MAKNRSPVLSYISTLLVFCPFTMLPKCVSCGNNSYQCHLTFWCRNKKYQKMCLIKIASASSEFYDYFLVFYPLFMTNCVEQLILFYPNMLQISSLSSVILFLIEVGFYFFAVLPLKLLYRPVPFFEQALFFLSFIRILLRIDVHIFLFKPTF